MPTPRKGYFKKDGTKVSGVTTLTGVNLGWNKGPLCYYNWEQGSKGFKYMEKAQEAADAGTCGHYLVDCDIHGISPDLSKFTEDAISKGENAFLNYLEWKKGFNIKVLHTEIQLVSEEYSYGATPDCIAEANGKVCLLDWKTGNSIYSETKIQLAAYAYVVEEVGLAKIEGFHCVRFDKGTAAFAHYYWHSLPEAWEAFKLVLELEKLRKILK